MQCGRSDECVGYLQAACLRTTGDLWYNNGGFGAVVQRIGHIPSKDTMLVRFQPALPNLPGGAFFVL